MSCGTLLVTVSSAVDGDVSDENKHNVGLPAVAPRGFRASRPQDVRRRAALLEAQPTLSCSRRPLSDTANRATFSRYLMALRTCQCVVYSSMYIDVLFEVIPLFFCCRQFGDDMMSVFTLTAHSSVHLSDYQCPLVEQRNCNAF